MRHDVLSNFVEYSLILNLPSLLDSAMSSLLKYKILHFLNLPPTSNVNIIPPQAQD